MPTGLTTSGHTDCAFRSGLLPTPRTQNLQRIDHEGVQMALSIEKIKLRPFNLASNLRCKRGRLTATNCIRSHRQRVSASCNSPASSCKAPDAQATTRNSYNPTRLAILLLLLAP
eukprot:1149884-Rhodomonas_salina.6